MKLIFRIVNDKKGRYKVGWRRNGVNIYTYYTDSFVSAVKAAIDWFRYALGYIPHKPQRNIKAMREFQRELRELRRSQYIDVQKALKHF